MEENGSLMARESAAGYATVTYADVMDYIHSVHMSREDKQRVKDRLSFELSQPAIEDAYARIEHLSTLQKDWDGEGALPISHKVLNNLKRVLMISKNADWENWAISPDSNATVGLQSSSTKACVILGAYEYSYYARINGVRYGDSHIDFTPESFLELLRKFG